MDSSSGDEEMNENMIELKTARSLYSEHARSFYYDESLSGQEVLDQVVTNLHFKDPGPYVLIARIANTYKFVPLDAPLKNMSLAPKTQIVAIRQKFPVKIVTEHEFTRTIMIDLTTPIRDDEANCDLLAEIAEKLRFRCQSNQYSLWCYDATGDLKPLDFRKPIGLQTSDYKRLIFKRRAYLVFNNEFEDIDNAMHVYRDVKDNYLTGPITCTAEQAIDLGKLIIYGNTFSAEQAKELAESLDDNLQGFLPKCLANSSSKAKANIKKEIVTAILEGEPQDKLSAMTEFIWKTRVLDGYGCEVYTATWHAPKNVRMKVLLWIGPRGLKVISSENQKEQFFVPILRMTTFSMRDKKLTIRWAEKEKGTCSEVFKLHAGKAEAAYVHLDLNIQVLLDHYKPYEGEGKSMRRITQKIEQVDGQYKTLTQSLEAINLFMEEMKLYDDIDFIRYGLKTVTTSEECKADDITGLVELEELEEFLDDSELRDMMTRYMPVPIARKLKAESLKTKITTLDSNIKIVRGSVFKMSIDEAVLLLNSGLEYINVIIGSYPNLELEQILEQPKGHLVTLAEMANEYYNRKHGMSDLSQTIVEQANMIVKELQAVMDEETEGPIYKLVTYEEIQPVDNPSDRRLPYGQLSILAAIKFLDELLDYIYTNALPIMKPGKINIRKYITPLGEILTRARTFADQLLNETCQNKQAVFNHICEPFGQLNELFAEVHKSKTLERAHLDAMTGIIKKILGTFGILQRCFLEPGQFIGIKLFPGTVTYMFFALNAYDEMDQTLRSLAEFPFAQTDPVLKEKLPQAIETITKTRSRCLTYHRELEKNPSDQEMRVNTIQMLHECKNYMYDVYEALQSYVADVDCSAQFNGFFEKMDNSLFSLTIDNCSPQRIDMCIKSLNAIVSAMTEKGIDERWIDRLTVTMNTMKKLYDKIREKPTDGTVLQPLHQLMWETLKDVQLIDRYLSIADHRTIPLIIELMSPAITRSLGNPYMNDEFEKCEHILVFAQAHHDIERVINMIICLLEKPHAKMQKDVVEDLSKRVKVLETLYQELTHYRLSLFTNPYTWDVVLPVMNLFDEAKHVEANMISKVRVLDNINMNHAVKKLLSKSMETLTTFGQLVETMNIRPYRRLPTTESIKTYRKSVMDLVCALRDIVDPLPRVIEDDASHIMKYWVRQITDAGKQPSHRFDAIVADFNQWLEGVRTRYNDIKEFREDNRSKEKLNDVMRTNMKIIRGEEATDELLEELLNKAVEWINKFHDVMPGKNFSEATMNIIRTCDEYFQSLQQCIQPFLETRDFSEDNRHYLKVAILKILRSCPPVPEDINETTDKQASDIFNHTLVALDDAVNLIRQIQNFISIDLRWQKLEVSIADEIKELGEVIIEQLEILFTIFRDQISPHILVRKSQRLSSLVGQLQQFFDNNYNILKKDQDNIETVLKQFCREIEPTLKVIIDNISIMNPILSDTSLIESCEALHQNVKNAILMFDRQKMTDGAAKEFVSTAMFGFQNLQSLLDMAIDDPLNMFKGEFVEFMKQTKDLMDAFPENVLELKPTQLQRLIDGVYQHLSENLMDHQSELDRTGLAVDMISLYNTMGKYTSRDKRQILSTGSLVIKQQVIAVAEIDGIFSQAVDQLNRGNHETSLLLAELLMSQFEKLGDRQQLLPTHINTAQKLLSPHLSQSGLPVVLDCLRVLACSEKDTSQAVKHEMEILIQASIRSADILSEIQAQLDNIEKVTKYHEQLKGIIPTMNLSMLKDMKNLPSVLLTYNQMRHVDHILPLLLNTEESFVKLCDEYHEMVHQADLALQAMFMTRMDRLVNLLEKAGRDDTFVTECTKLLQNQSRSVVLNVQTLSKLSELYIQWEGRAGTELTLQAGRNEFAREAKQQCEEISQLKPILTQWMNANMATSEPFFKQNMQSLLTVIKHQITSCQLSVSANPQKIPLLFTQPLTEFYRIQGTLDDAEKNGIDVSELKKMIDDMIPVIEKINKACNQVFVEALSEQARETFETSFAEVLDLLEPMIAAIGPIELLADVEVSKVTEEEKITQEDSSDEEEKKPEEEEVPEVDAYELALGLMNAINVRGGDTLSQLLETLNQALERGQESVEPLREFYTRGINALEAGQFGSFGMMKHDIVQFLVSNIKWQSGILNSIESVNEISDHLIDKQTEFSEIASTFQDDDNKTEKLKKLALITADSQSLAVHSFHFFQHLQSDLYYDMVETTVQAWESIQVLFGAKIDDVTTKRAFRSAARLLAGFSYLTEDAAFQETDQKVSEFEAARSKFLSTVSQLCFDTSSAISMYAGSPVIDVYLEVSKSALEGFQRHIDAMITAGQTLLDMNTSSAAAEAFTTRQQGVVQAFEDFQIAARSPCNLKMFVGAGQKVHNAIQQLIGAVKQLTDVVVLHPDMESASKLPQNFVMPALPSEILSIADADAEFREKNNMYTANVAEFRRKLLEQDATNEELVSAIISLFEQTSDMIKTSMRVSMASSDFAVQSSVISTCSKLGNAMDALNKAVRFKLLLKPGWVESANEVLNCVSGCIEEVIRMANISLEALQKKEAEDDEIKEQFDEATKPVASLPNEISLLSTAILQKPDSVQRQMGVSLCDLASGSSNAITKLMIHLRNRQNELNGSLDDLKAGVSKAVDVIRTLMTSINDIVNTSDEELGKAVVNVVQPLTPMITEMSNFCNAKSTEGVNAKTNFRSLETTVKSIVTLGEEIHRAQLERAEAARKRAEAAAARKAAAEERKKKIAEERAERAKQRAAAAAARSSASRGPIKTKDQLMKRLELESNVLIARIALEDAQQRLKDYAK